MAPPHTRQLTGRAHWTLMKAIHDALRRELDQLLHTASTNRPGPAGARSEVSCVSTSPPSRRPCGRRSGTSWLATRTARPSSTALDNEHQLLGPLQVMIDDAFTMRAGPGGSASCWPGCGPGWPVTSPTRKPTPCRSSARSSPPASSAESPPPSAAGQHPAHHVPWALAGTRPDVREHVLSQLPAPARLLYQTVWLPRYTRTTPPL